MNTKKKLVALSTISMALAMSAALCGNALVANADQYNTPQLRAALSEVGWSADHALLKPATDFAGNPYVIGESRDGNGHFIYNVDEDILTEFSFKGESPYHDLTSGLIYGGMGEYYVQRGDEYASIMESGVTYQESEIAPCAAYQEAPQDENGITAYASSENISVKHPEFFYENLKQHCGYFYRSGLGQCGFIALAMTIAYADQYEYGRIVNDSQYFATYDDTRKLGMISNNDNGQNCDRDKTLLGMGYIPLGEYLYNLHPKDSTTSMHIKETMFKYVEKRNSELRNGEFFKIDYSSLYWGFFGDSNIENALRNDHPVILFGNHDASTSPGGNTSNLGNHAVVCYGLLQAGGKSYWRCHVGYNGSGSADAYIATGGLIGSMYYFEITEKGF